MEQFNKMFNDILIYFSYAKLTEYTIPVITKTIIILCAFVAIRITTKFVNKSLTNVCKRKQIDHHTCHIIKKTVRYIITALGMALALQNIGVQVSPLLTAFGVSGIALSFGMKDIISNIIAGVLIMIYKQFKIGDYIKIKDWQGKVIDINIRYTTLKTDDMTVFIPNSVLYTTTVAILHKENT